MKSTNTLLYKWLVGNSFAFLILVMVTAQGWVALVLENDASYLTWAMSVIFIIFWGVSAYQIVNLNREINRFENSSSEGIAAQYFEKLREKSRNQGGAGVDQTLLAGTLRGRMMMSFHIIQYVANTLILLGLIGTVVGFVIAVSGLGETLGEGENLDRVKGVLGQIVNGMGVALFTTLVGSVLGGLWLQVHYQMLIKAGSYLLFGIVDRAEVEVIPRLATGRDSTPAPVREKGGGLSAEPAGEPA